MRIGTIGLKIIVAVSLIFLPGLPVKAESLTSKLGKVWHKYTQTSKGPRLACLTAYWPSDAQGGYYTSHRKSSTGITLRKGHCAVDPDVIPYGSIVNIKNVGKFLAVDTGEAVVSRRVAREIGKTRRQRKALVIDIFFPSHQAAKDFIKNNPKFADITWREPDSTSAKERKLFPDGDWAKLKRF